MLGLKDVRRLADDEARAVDPTAEVIAAVSCEGGRCYAEVLLVRHVRGEITPQIIGVDRVSEHSVRAAVRQGLIEGRRRAAPEASRPD
jgi:hypothetical protein